MISSVTLIQPSISDVFQWFAIGCLPHALEEAGAKVVHSKTVIVYKIIN